MIGIRFNIVKEFLEELKKEAQAGGEYGDVRDGIVRVTVSYVPSRVTPNVSHVTILASFVTTRGHLVKLSHPVGELWGVGKGDEETRARASETLKALEDGIIALGLQVRAGTFEEPRS